MRWLGLGAAWVAATTLTSGLAWAQPGEAREITLVVDPSIPCVHFDALASALRRDTPFDVHLSPKTAIGLREAPSGTTVRLGLAAGEGSITVRMDTEGLHVSEVLRPSSCETTTDVIAAFVTSSLSPAPALPASPRADSRPPFKAPASAPVVHDGLETNSAQRAALLADTLSSHISGGTRNTRRGLGIAVAAIGVGAAVYGAAILDDPKTSPYGWAFLGAGALEALAGTSMALLPDEAPESLTVGPALLAAGVLTTSVNASLDPPMPRWAIAGILGGYVGQEGMFVARDLMGPPLTLRRTRSLYQSIRTPDQRAALRAEQFEAIENEVIRARSPIAPWVMVLPMTLGGGVAMAGALDTDLPRSTRVFVGVQGGVMLVNALVYGLHLAGSPDREYLDRLETTGFQVGVSPVPGGSTFSLSRRF